MSQYTDIIEGITSWTNKPHLTAEMDFAIRQAVNKAHRAGHFPRDIVTEAITVPIAKIQEIDYTVAPFARFRQLAGVKPAELEMEYIPVQHLDLFDADGLPRTDICYVVGNMIYVRASYPVENLTVKYWQRPDLADLTLMDDWIVEAHFDLIVLWSAASVLATIGEQEIKTRVEALARIAYTDLIAEATESAGR